MKTGWGTKKLGEICRIELGSTPPRKSPRFWDVNRETNNVWLSIADLSKLNTKHVSSSKEHLSDEGANKVKIVPAGTLMVSFKLTLGKLAYAKIDLRTNEAIAALNDLDVSIVSKEFLFWFLSFFNWDEAAKGEEKVKGKTLNKAKLKEIVVIVPPLPEQRRIVEVLDAAFAKIDRLEEITKQNIINAEELFDSALLSAFSANGNEDIGKTLREISTDFGRGKSKHRPRNDPSLYGEAYPFVQTGDVRNCEQTILSYKKSYNEKGLAQSKLWPKGTICITIAANIAETGILGFDACFPDSIIGIVVDEKQTTNNFVEFLLQSVKSHLKSKGKGSAQDNINLGTFENELFSFPSLQKQKEIVLKLNSLSSQLLGLERIYNQKLTALSELRQSLLQKAFAGELVSDFILSADAAAITDKIEKQAVVIALVYENHKPCRKTKTYGHVKTEKIIHMLEAANINFERKPEQDAAGPNDFTQFNKVMALAEERQYFTFTKRDTGKGYVFNQGRNFLSALEHGKKVVATHQAKFDKIVSLMAPMKTRETEVFATIYAAWNNFLLEGKTPTDNDIYQAASENWHERKKKFTDAEFSKGINTLRNNDIIPEGTGVYVTKKSGSAHQEGFTF